MLFCVKTPINKLYVFGLALLLTLTLAGCGGGNGSAMMPDTDPPVVDPDPPVDPDPDPPVEPGPTPEEIAAMTEAAKTKAEAINAEDAGSTTAPFDSASDTENYTVTSVHEDGAVVVNVAIPGAAMDAPEFMRTDALPPIEGWDGSMHTLGPNDDGETEIVGVYTDIAPPVPTPFSMVYTLDVNTNTENDSPAVTNEAFAIDRIDAASVGRIMSPGFTAGGAAVLTFDMDDSSTTDVDEAFETAGSYDGAPGVYRCNGNTNCTVTLDADGKITSVGDGWIFTPDEGATADVPDSDYLYYGFWVKKTDTDGVTTYNAVQTFSGANGVSVFPTGELQNVMGSASYAGGAAGVYMKKTFTTDGEIDTATSGTFSADVSLTAIFGGRDVPANKHYTIEGSISNFALSGGEENAWSVDLESVFTIVGSTFSGAANGGGDEAAWNGAFYGAAVETPATDDDNAKLAPESVVGEFNAHFSNGHVAGGFGAHRQ